MHNNQKFWGDYADIQDIKLEEKHLIIVGFKKYETKENLTKFTLNNIVISSSSILVSDNESLFISGFVLGDLTVPIDFGQYLYENKIGSEKFYKDFPMMNTLSDLFGYFKKNNL